MQIPTLTETSHRNAMAGISGKVENIKICVK